MIFTENCRVYLNDLRVENVQRLVVDVDASKKIIICEMYRVDPVSALEFRTDVYLERIIQNDFFLRTIE